MNVCGFSQDLLPGNGPQRRQTLNGQVMNQRRVFSTRTSSPTPQQRTAGTIQREARFAIAGVGQAHSERDGMAISALRTRERMSGV